MSAFDAAARRAPARPGAGGGGAFGAAAAAGSTPAGGVRVAATGGGGASAGSAGGAAGLGYQSADSEYSRVCDSIEKELRSLGALVATLRKQTESVGGPRDSADLRAKIIGSVDKGKLSVTTIGAFLKRDLAPAVDAPDVGPEERAARRMQQQRFLKEYKEVGQAYQEAATAMQAAQRRFPPPAAPAPSGGAAAGGKKGKKGAAADSDPLLQKAALIDFDVAMVEEREEAIADIASAITEVNEAMRDLAVIVEEQGEGIRTIEANVASAHEQTEAGVGHLVQAEKYQKGYRKWIVALLCIIILAAGGIAAWFVITKRS